MNNNKSDEKKLKKKKEEVYSVLEDLGNCSPNSDFQT